MKSRRPLNACVIVLSLIVVVSAMRIDTVTRSATRLASPEDRYAMANGCYAIKGASGYLGRAGSWFITSLTDASAGEPFYFKATDLGSYLLYTTARTFLAAGEGAIGAATDVATKNAAGEIGSGATVGTTDTAAEALKNSAANVATGRGATVIAAPKATELADWQIDQVGSGGFEIYLPALGKYLVADRGLLVLRAVAHGTHDASMTFTFTLVDGCTPFPEIEVNVDGPVATGMSAITEVRGYLDAHVHAMAYEFIGGRSRCGRPWHRFGVDQALVDCADHGTNGQTAALEMVLSGGDPVTGHNPDGWPSFVGWPRRESLTHEQIYYKWLERAWRGGVRMITNLLVDNHALCEAYPLKKNSCNEMDGVRLQAKRIRELERYIDAQSGGPGEGWLRIVTNPFQARETINAGKLAVILGIEVSSPLNCGEIRDVPLCDEKQIDRELDEMYALGVRQMELANKFDNALTGVTGDAGTTGIVVNNGNMLETGSYWAMGSCSKDAGDATDKTQINPHDQGAPDQLTGRDSIFAGALEVAGASGAAPLYPQGPHCNKRGLSALGVYAVKGLMKRGMIFDPDHMSARARAQAMDVIHAAGYSGAVSSHSWADKTIYPRVYQTGGVVTPHTSATKGFIEEWQRLRREADPRFYFGFGFGSDVNGFSAQPPPRKPTDGTQVRYPFTGFGGAIINKQHSGTRVYDINTDGVAHYGLYPDWVEDLRKVGGEQIVEDLQRGPEAYLQAWERAIGIAPDACRTDVPDLNDAAFGTVGVGMTAEQVLRAIGQPSSRASLDFRFCLQSGRSGVVSFGLDERVTGTAIFYI